MEQEISKLVLAVANLPGRIEKVKMLKDTYDSWDELYQESWNLFLNYVFRVDYAYRIKWNAAWHYDESWCPDTPKDQNIGFVQIIDHFNNILERKIGGDDAYEKTRAILENAANIFGFHIGKMILNRSLDCGVDRKTIAKLFPAVLPFTPAMMKCEPAEAKTLKKLRYPAMLQLKVDAMRVNADVQASAPTSFWTYNGTEFSIEHEELLQELAEVSDILEDRYSKNMFLDGELIVYSMGKPLPRKKSNGQANRILKGTAPIDVHEQVHIVLWDVIDRDSVVAKKSEASNITRFNDLSNAINGRGFKYISFVEHCMVRDEDEAYEQVSKWIERGEEGGVAKNCNAPWEGKRSANCIKFKAERECDLRVLGYNPGEAGKKYEGLVGSWICGTDDKKLVVDVSGMTDAERAVDPDTVIGKIVAVRFNEVITNEKNPDLLSLFLPRILEIREPEDKNETDTTEFIVALKPGKKAE